MSSAATVPVPAELRGEFRRFREDFEIVWQTWIASGEESAESYELARGSVRDWLQELHGQADATEQLRQAFDYWSALAHRLQPRERYSNGLTTSGQAAEANRIWRENRVGGRNGRA